MSAYIIDTEATGLEDPVVVQTALLRVDHTGAAIDGVIEVRSWNPGRAITWGAMATHHILPEEVAGLPPSSSFALPSDCIYLIGHNVDFDWAAIGRPEVKRICTLALARSLWPELDSHTLGALAYFVASVTGQQLAQVRKLLRGAHDAGIDVGLCAELLREICRRINPTSLADLWQKSERARIPTVMPFGKHKGTPIATLPSDYKAWALRQPDLDPYVKKAIAGGAR